MECYLLDFRYSCSWFPACACVRTHARGAAKNTTSAQYGADGITPPLPKRPGLASPDFEGDRAEDGCTNCDPEAIKPKVFTMEVCGMTFEAKDLKDELGQDIPVGRFAEYIQERLHIDEAVKTLRALKHAIQARAEKDDFRAYSGPARKADDIVANLDIAINSIRERKPEVLCRCNGEGCRACQGRGFLTKKQYQTIIPEEERFVAGTL